MKAHLLWSIGPAIHLAFDDSRADPRPRKFPGRTREKESDEQYLPARAELGVGRPVRLVAAYGVDVSNSV